MFDRIMENSMPIWLIVSAVFPIFLIGMIVKAILHLRRMRALSETIARERILVIPEREVWSDKVWAETNDWVPSP